MNPLRYRNATRRLIGVALLALFLGQWAVLAHSIDHARVSAAVAGVADADGPWGHQAGASACHLVDHLLMGQVPGGEPAAAEFGRSAGLLRAASPTSLAASPGIRAYDARGPPWA